MFTDLEGLGISTLGARRANDLILIAEGEENRLGIVIEGLDAEQDTIRVGILAPHLPKFTCYLRQLPADKKCMHISSEWKIKVETEGSSLIGNLDLIETPGAIHVNQGRRLLCFRNLPSGEEPSNVDLAKGKIVSFDGTDKAVMAFRKWRLYRNQADAEADFPLMEMDLVKIWSEMTESA